MFRPGPFYGDPRPRHPAQAQLPIERHGPGQPERLCPRTDDPPRQMGEQHVLEGVHTAERHCLQRLCDRGEPRDGPNHIHGEQGAQAPAVVELLQQRQLRLAVRAAPIKRPLQKQ